MGRGAQRILLGTAAAVTLAAGAYILAAMGRGDGVSRGFTGVAPFGAWRLICVPAPAPLDGLVPESAAAAKGQSANACRVNQEVPLAGANVPSQVILAANLSLVGTRKTPALMLRLPATAQAGDMIGMRLDNRYDVKFAVHDCEAAQCIAAGNLSGDDWTALLAAKTVQVRFAAADGQMVLVDLKPGGLAAAVAAMSRADGS